MSYNRATIQPCTNCCSPTTYSTESVNWLQDISGTAHNIDATQGVFYNSISINASSLVFRVPTACSKSTTYCDSDPLTHSESGTAKVSSDPTSCNASEYWTSCQSSDSCTDPPCSSGSDWGCDGSGAEEYAVKCFSKGTFGYTNCYPTFPYDDVASTTMGAAGYIQQSSNGTSTIDADWYASSVSIKGTPETFIGYPVEVDGCSSYAKGLRKIFARKTQSSNLQVRWYVAKEWDTGSPENKVYGDEFAIATNELGELYEGLELNEDVAIRGIGETSNKNLWRNLRLGDGTGDDSFGEDSGWYDITDNAVEFQYTKPNSYSYTIVIFADYYGASGAYCCDDFCGCQYANWTFRSDYAQILTSDDVTDPDTGDCVWDSGAGGENFGGSYTEYSNEGIAKAGASLNVS
jgi:hypothetical protein